MFEEFFKKIICYLFGKIIENFPASDLTFNKWNGVVHKKNLLIRSEFIDNLGANLGIPLFLKRGIIGSLHMQIPWNKIWTQPCKIILEDIHILIETSDIYAKSFHKKRKDDKKLKEIKALNKNEKVFDENSEKIAQKNYLKKLKEVVMANMQLEVKNFHFRFEDNGKIIDKTKFSIGFIYETLIYCPSNIKFEKNAFIDPEKVKIEKVKYNLTEIINLAIYFDNSESTAIWLDIPDISTCDYLKFIENSNNCLKIILDQKSGFNNFMVHPLNIQIHKTTTLSRELVNMTTTPHKKNSYFIENVHVCLDNEQYRILKEILKFKKWHNQHESHKKFSPPYLINPMNRPVAWWKYAKKAVLYINKKKRHAGKLENLKKIKNKRNEYIYLFQIKLLYDAESQDKSLKKTKIFETTTFEYDKEGEIVQRDLGDLEEVLIEYEMTFCIDEIIVYRQQALNLIKDTKNIIHIIEKQNKIAQAAKRPYRIVTVFKWMREKFSRNKQDLKIDENEYQFIQEFVNENSLQADFSEEKAEYIKEIIELNLSLCKLEIFSTRNKNSKFSFFIMLFEDICLEKSLFFMEERFSLKIGRILAEDSLTTLQLFHIIFAPKEFDSFQKKYEAFFQIKDHDDEVFYDQEEFIYNKDFINLSIIKSLGQQQTIEAALFIKPFEYIFNYEVFTRIKYFINPKPGVKEESRSYNSFSKFNDFLHEGKEKAEEFIKEKLKSILGHSLDLKLNILASDLSFIIPDSVSREKTPILMINVETFCADTPKKEKYKMELKIESEEKPQLIEPDVVDEDTWEIKLKIMNLSSKFITFHQNSNPPSVIKFNLINPMNLNFDLQRKFKEYKGLLTSEIKLIFESSEIKLNIPILKEPNFINILLKFLNFFKNKTKVAKPLIHHRPNKPEHFQKQKNKGFLSVKNYYSLTVSRKSSALASNEKNEDEFFEAFDDLEDLLIHQESSMNHSNIIKESQVNESLKRKNVTKLQKVVSYFKENEVTFIQIQNFLEFRVEIHCPKISLEIYEDMIHNKYIGSCYEINDIALIVFTKNQESLLNISFDMKELLCKIYRFDKLSFLIPKSDTSTLTKSSSSEESPPNFLMYLSSYSIDTKIKLPKISVIFLDISDSHRNLKPLLKIDFKDLEIFTKTPISLEPNVCLDLVSRFSIIVSNISHNQETFEPFLEKLSTEIHFSNNLAQKKLNISFFDDFLMNLTPQSIETLLIFRNNLQKMRTNQKSEIIFENLFTKSSNSYTFHNKTGRTIVLWFSENREDVWYVENNQEKFIEFDNSFTLADFFDFSEFQSKKKRRLTTKISQLYFSFSDKKQVFTLNLQGITDVYLDYSRYQRIKANIFEKNGIKNVIISSNISFENRLRFNLALHFEKAFDFDTRKKQNFDEVLIIQPFKSLDLPLFKDNYDGFRLRIYQKENPEIYEWSNIGSFSLLIERNTPISFKSRVFRDNENFEYFNLIAMSQKLFEKCEISLNYPTKISNFLPFALKIRMKNHQKQLENSEENKMNWFLNKQTFDINEIWNFSLEMKKKDSDEIVLSKKSKYFTTSKESNSNNNSLIKQQSNLTNNDLEKEIYEENIDPGSNIYSNLIEYNSNFLISLLIPDSNWSDFLEIMPSFDKNIMIFHEKQEYLEPPLENKEFFYFQLFNAFQEQITIILERSLENGINNLVFFSECWLLNETPFPLLARIKESNYEYPPLKLPEFLINVKERPMGSHLVNGFSNISGVTQNKERNLNAISYEQINYPVNSCENFEKIFGSLNASYFSTKDLKDLLKKQANHLIPFSGNLDKNNKKISFKLENLSGWSEFVKISENKASIISQFQKENLFYNFNYLNIRLPGKFKRTSLIFITAKYFLINLSEFQLEVKILEGKNKRNLLRLEKGMIETLFNFKDENDIKISVRINKSEYIWTSELPIRNIGSYNIGIKNVFTNQKVILTMNVTTFSSNFVISFENSQNWPPLKLENSTIYHFKIHQRLYEESAEVLPSHKTSAFAWENPFESNILTINVLASNRQYCKITELNLETYKDKKCQIEVPSKFLEESENKIFIDISLESTSRFIKFHHNLNVQNEILDNENHNKKDNLKFSLYLQKFGLSLIDASPKEILYLEVNSVKFILKKVHDYFDVRLGVLDFQIDVENNRKMEVLFGVPKKLKVKKEGVNKETFGEKIFKFQNLWKKPQEKNVLKYQKFIDFKLQVSNNQKNLYYIKNLLLKILPFDMIFYGKPIDNLYKFYISMVEMTKKYSPQQIEKKKLSLDDFAEKSVIVEEHALDMNKINVMVDKIKIHPIEFQTRFESLHYLNETFSFLSMIKVLTLMFNTLGSNRISLPHYELINHKLSLNELMHQIFFTYKGKFWKFFSAIYSAGVIGNPEKLFKELGHTLKISSFDLIVNASQSNFSYASFRFVTFLIPRCVQTLNESFQIMWIHLEKGLLYQIEDKKASLLIEKKNVANHKNINSFSSILQSFFGLAHATLLFPYSQGYVPFMLKNVKKPEQGDYFKMEDLQPKRYKRYINKKSILEPYNYEKAKSKQLLINFGFLKEDQQDEIIYVSQISKEILLVFLTKNFILINDKKILLNILIPYVVSFICDGDKLNIKYLLEFEKDSVKPNSPSGMIEEQFLKFSSIELKTSLNEIDRAELSKKFEEISQKQYLINNKINIFKL